MPYATYRSLPIEALYDLLTISVVDLIGVLDSKPYNEEALKELKKQIEALVVLIGEKKQGIRTN